MHEIEAAAAKTRKCDCGCGDTRSLLRFVSDDGKPVGAYSAYLRPPSHGVVADVGLTMGGEYSGPKVEKVSFALRLAAGESGTVVTVVEPEESMWSEEGSPFLSAADALAHPRLPEVFAVTDAMLAQDTVLAAYFGHAVAVPSRASRIAAWLGLKSGLWRAVAR